MNGSASLRSPQGSPEPTAEESGARIYHSSNLSRERAMTTSSYASTAVAPQLETSIPISETSLESDFGNMFSGLSLGDRKSNNATPQPLTRQLTQPPPRAFVRAVSSWLASRSEVCCNTNCLRRTPNLSCRRASLWEACGLTSRACLRPYAPTLAFL